VGIKKFFSNLISLSLIGFGLYQVFYTANLLFFVYPNLKIDLVRTNWLWQEGLVEKAIVYWISMIFDAFYGIFLLFKHEEEVNLFHLAAGVLIGIFSFFFVKRTPLTISPVEQMILKYFNQ